MHCVLRVYFTLLQVQLEEYSYVEDSSGGHRWIPVSFSLDVFFILLFNYRTLNSGIVINNFQEPLLYEMD